MKVFLYALTALLISKADSMIVKPNLTSDVSFWLTKGDRSALLQKQDVQLNFSATTNNNLTIEVDESQVFNRWKRYIDK
jgi:hypothetical protein